MKVRISKALMLEYRQRVGGHAQATAKVMACLKCGVSKADKIASGHYPSTPSPLEREALARLIGVEESALFVPVAAGAKNRAS